jgi:signal peptidase
MGWLPAWTARAGKVANWLATLLAVLMLITFIGWVTLPRVLNLQGVVVLTGSMEPALPVGSIAFVQKMGSENVAAGDVLTFYRPDVPRKVLVTHRVVEVSSDRDGLLFRTRGDANNEVDDWVVRGPQVVGTVGTVLPRLGYVTDLVRGRNGFIALMAIPGALIVIGELAKIRRELKVMRQEKSAP